MAEVIQQHCDNLEKKSKKACVIGGSGYVGSQLVKLLLVKGYSVNTTVRDPGNANKISHLIPLQDLGDLKIFDANLTDEGSFDAAVEGCGVVFLVATPVNFASEDPEGYPVSKTLAEKTALKFAEENSLDVITVIPSLIAGAATTPHVPNSIRYAACLLTGDESVITRMKRMQILLGSFSITHVDDVCLAHIFLAEKESAAGRYICCAVNTSVLDLAKFLSKRYPQYNVPTHFGEFPAKAKLILSSEKLVNEGFEFKYGINEIYDTTVEYLKSKDLLKD